MKHTFGVETKAENGEQTFIFHKKMTLSLCCALSGRLTAFPQTLLHYDI